jgi:DNA primase small subunit
MTTTSGGAPTYNPSDLNQYLKTFYEHVFPAELMVSWLSYGTVNGDTAQAFGALPANYFPRREWSFTSADDVYSRYRNFNTASALRDTLVRDLPHKIDIGAVFSMPPPDHTSAKPGAFFPVERELVFDIDMTDYDGTRTCCTGASICARCWPFMTVAVKVVDDVLRREFGFEHLLWVYSGRRGIHCWVADERARRLSNQARDALVAFLSVYKGSENNRSKTDVTAPLHPYMQHALDDHLAATFESLILGEQDCFRDEQGWTRLLEAVPFKDIVELMTTAWSSGAGEQGSAARWAELRTALEGRGVRGAQVINDIVFSYTYPRLDVNVSTHMNHLLKSPFCVHPKTGRVCVAFAAADADSFDPFDTNVVPLVSQFSHEIDLFNKKHAADEGKLGLPAWEKTSLAPAVKTLQKFLAVIFDKARAAKIAERQQRACFVFFFVFFVFFLFFVFVFSFAFFNIFFWFFLVFFVHPQSKAWSGEKKNPPKRDRRKCN